MTDSTSALDQQLSDELQGEFEIERLLGEGHKARVYLAREAALQRHVAIKVLLPDLAADDVARKRFDREARSVARIQHPNIAGVYRVGALSNDIPYLVMEYVEGRTLAQELEMDGPVDVASARAILGQLASALGAAHAKGIVHRDVRPGSVLRERGTGRVVLTDFGLAAVMARSGPAVTRLTRVGELLGDPRHLSPEELRGEPANEESDVYALGVMGYELLTGDGPFPGLSGVQLVTAHLRDAPPALNALRPDVPPDLAQILSDCLSKSPERRPKAVNVAARMEGAGAQSGASTPKPAGAMAGFLWELKRRRVYRVAGAYLGLMFIGLGAIDAAWESLPFPDWSYDVAVWVLLAGFPASLVLAWLYDITTFGIRRTSEADGGGSSVEALTCQRVLMGLGLLVGLALVVTLGWWFLGR
jgi:serine/threonine-protein kinase